MPNYKNHPLIKVHSTTLWFEGGRTMVKKHKVCILNALSVEKGTIYDSLRGINNLRLKDFEEMKTVIFYLIYTGKIEPLEEPNDSLQFAFKLHLDENDRALIF